MRITHFIPPTWLHSNVWKSCWQCDVFNVFKVDHAYEHYNLQSYTLSCWCYNRRFRYSKIAQTSSETLSDLFTNAVCSALWCHKRICVLVTGRDRWSCANVPEAVVFMDDSSSTNVNDHTMQWHASYCSSISESVKWVAAVSTTRVGAARAMQTPNCVRLGARHLRLYSLQYSTHCSTFHLVLLCGIHKPTCPHYMHVYTVRIKCIILRKTLACLCSLQVSVIYGPIRKIIVCLIYFSQENHVKLSFHFFSPLFPQFCFVLVFFVTLFILGFF